MTRPSTATGSTSSADALQALQDYREHRCRMRVMCKDYVRKPVAEMTGDEAVILADTMALSAAHVIRIKEPKYWNHQRTMYKDELQQYRSSILGAIQYFNSRDQKHLDHMRYLAECRKLMEIQEEKRRRQAEKKKTDIIVHIL